MAGRVKHAQRSHYSYKNDNYTQFFRKCNMHAYTKAMEKQQKMTLGQALGALVRKMMPQKREG